MAAEFPKGPKVVDQTKIFQMVEPSVPNYQEMSRCVAVAKKGKAEGELLYPRGVAIHSKTNHIYVADIGRVSVFSETGEFLNSFSSEHMRSPCGIAIHRDNLYVTDKEAHFIFHFRVAPEIRFVDSLEGKGSDFGQFDMPRQLSVSTNGDLFIADCMNHRIQILDRFLHYQRQITHRSIKYPWDVKLRSDVVYILMSFHSTYIHLFHYYGGKIRSVITREKGVGRYISVTCFCLDAKGNIIISDALAHQIKIFSKKGSLLHTLGEKGNEVGTFKIPYGIALTTNRKLVVVSKNKNYGLQIFSCYK